jgi:uncharacterized protein (TIGR04255 family)
VSVPHRELSKKPLVEAILELRWQLEPLPDGEGRDPHYKLLIGRLFDRLQSVYPEYEPLPIASMPDELVGYIAQHRFRVSKDQWPLVQIGPGVVTFNETSGYHWEDFQQRARDVVVKLFDAYPKVADLKVQSLLLRYIDAVEFDYLSRDVFEFWKEKLKVKAELPDSLFANTGVEKLPVRSSWQTMFRCTNPPGHVQVSFATGQSFDKPAIIWETTVRSAGSDLPAMPDGFPAWIDAAHKITSDWFFKLIEGDLERSFDGE